MTYKELVEQCIESEQCMGCKFRYECNIFENKIQEIKEPWKLNEFLLTEVGHDTISD